MKRIAMIVGMIVTCTALADEATERQTATSWKYVDYQLSNRQDTIPAGNGDRAVIYPNSTGNDTSHDEAGEIDARDIKTTLGNETTNQSDTGLTTVETVNTALNDKQATLYKQPSVNVVTYTGTNDDPNGYVGRGIPTTTPIYDTTTNTYGNGLVRASTLNTAVGTAASGALTAVDAGWLIGDIGNVLPTTIYAQPSDTPTGYCYNNIEETSYPMSQGGTSGCSNTLWNNAIKVTNGDWGVTFNHDTGISYPGDTCDGQKCYKEVHGISACSASAGSGTYGVMDPDDISATLQADYEMYRTSGSPRDTNPPKKYCHCKLTEPHAGVSTAVSPWVFYSTYGSPGSCALYCALNCAFNVRYYARFRGAVFGGVAQ